MDRLVPYMLVGLAQGVRAAQALAVAVIFARGLNDEARFGEVSYAMTISALFLPLFELGSTTILVREFSRNSPRSGDWLSTAVGAKFVVSLLIIPAAWLASWLASQWMNGPSGLDFLVAAFSASYLFRCLEPYENWAISQRDFFVPAVARCAGLGVMLIVLLAALWSGASLWWCAMLNSLSFAAYSLIVYLLTRTRCPPPPGRWTWQPAIFREMFTEAAPLIISGLAVVLYMRLDILLLMPSQGAAAVAIYNAAARVSQGLYLVPSVMVDAVYPSLARLTPGDSGFLQAWQRAMDIQVLVALVLTVVMILLAPVIIPLIFGPAYVASVTVFQIHSASLISVAVGLVSSRFLAAAHLQRYTLLATGVGLAASLISNLILIPRYSVTGAALATCISYFLATSAVYYPFADTRKIVVMQWTAIRNLPSTLRAALRFLRSQAQARGGSV